MIGFNEFMEFYTEHAQEVFRNSKNLFVVNVDKESLWETYLESFPVEYNQMYRVRREMDCSCCKSFVRSFANVVSIQDNEIVSLWDFRTGDEGYDQVLEAMEQLVKSASIRDVFIIKVNSIGTFRNNELTPDGHIHTWNHLYVQLPKHLVFSSSLSAGEIMGTYRDVKGVFKRSLEEISTDATQEVLDLISEKLLYRGEEWNAVLDKFLKLQKEYKKLKSVALRDNFCWIKSIEVGMALAKIKNHSIGTLLMDISNGVDTEEAIRKYEVIVAPSNYKRPKPVITAKMIDSAQKTLESLGLLGSLGRRYAQISDITVNNVLWANRNAKKAMKGLNVFEEMKEEVAVNPKRFENVKGVGIEAFIQMLPNVKSLEVLVENRHEGNFLSLIAPTNKEAPSLFKWDNNFSWAYNGNMADSMKQRVKSAGGKVDGVLRFSIQWNTNKDNQNDFDAHCIEPSNNEIFFQNKGRIHSSSGMLDVDIVHPANNVAVENITWTDIRRMRAGKYLFFVHNYSHNGGTSGFDAEIEFNGELYEFSYHKDIRHKENINVAEVYVHEDKSFSIKPLLQHSMSNRTIWNISTNKFTQVSTFMFSPNYWNEQQGIGNKHYFFMLPNCINETNPNGFYNEYLKEDLNKHRKVFEALGSKMKVESSDVQLSGIGFSSTQRNYVIAKVDGNIIKIIF